MARTSEVLPAPLGPNSVTTCPGATVRDTPFTANTTSW